MKPDYIQWQWRHAMVMNRHRQPIRLRARVRKLPSGRYTWAIIDPLDVIKAMAPRPLPRQHLARIQAHNALQQFQTV